MRMITKDEAIAALRGDLEDKLTSAQRAYDLSHSGATSDQSKQESKYDTRGLEESYLANGLARAVRDLQTALADLDFCARQAPGAQVAVGHLVHCLRDGEQVSFLLSHAGGGVEVSLQGVDITIITPESPLAKQLIGKASGQRAAAFQVQAIL